MISLIDPNKQKLFISRYIYIIIVIMMIMIMMMIIMMMMVMMIIIIMMMILFFIIIYKPLNYRCSCHKSVAFAIFPTPGF